MCFVAASLGSGAWLSKMACVYTNLPLAFVALVGLPELEQLRGALAQDARLLTLPAKHVENAQQSQSS